MKIINQTDPEKAKREINSSKEKFIVVKAHSDKFNRKVLEYGKFNVLLSPEEGQRKQTPRQLDSGFNHVLGKIATKNKISIGIDLEEISTLNKKEKATRLSKIRQNIEICRKTKTKLAIKTKQNKEASSLLISFGASTQQAKEAIVF